MGQVTDKRNFTEKKCEPCPELSAFLFFAIDAVVQLQLTHHAQQRPAFYLRSAKAFSTALAVFSAPA